MKIRNDFVTNSSSSSFIFGGINHFETVGSIYNLIRMISNEIKSLYNQIEECCKSMNEWKDLQVLFDNTDEFDSESEYESDFYWEIYSKYVESGLLNYIFKNVLINSLFIIFYKDEDELLHDIKYILINSGMTGFNAILKYNSYADYCEGDYCCISIYDVLDENNDNDIVRECCYLFAEQYYKNESFMEVRKRINTMDKKSFCLNKLGNILVEYEDSEFIRLFDESLKSFCNFSTC